MNRTGPAGVVAAGHDVTAAAGARILRDGGNAVDAAIGAVAMACVAEPVLCSPGGGGFAIVRDGSSGQVSLIDFFPQTPKQRRVHGDAGVREVHADFGTATQAFHIGPATVATPGFFIGIRTLHRAGSGMTLTELVEPARRAARDGVLVTPFQHFLSGVVAPILTATPASRKVFAPEGHLVRAGENFPNPGIANALSALASDDHNAAVEDAVIASQHGQGHLTPADLRDYRAVPRLPVSVRFRRATVHMNPLPAAGGVLIGHSLERLDGTDPLALARAFVATGRARLDAGSDLSGLVAPTLLRQRGTTHVSVIDADGTACAVTISNGEGNGEVVGNFGYMLNNILGEEDVNPAGISDWPLDTRLSSMMCPTIIEHDDGGVVAMGSGGSNRIRTAICQVVVQLCQRDAGLAEAVNAPRLHVEGGHLDFEDFYSDAVRAGLTAAFPDHRAWPDRNLFYGGVHAVAMNADRSLEGVGDVRRDGTAIVVNR